MNSLLKLLNKQAYKADYVIDVTNGRSSSSKDLTDQEYETLVKILVKEVEPIKVVYDAKADRMRKKVISICHELGMHVPGTTQIDMLAVNCFCRNKGMFKKSLNQHNNDELRQLVSQFELILGSYYKAAKK